MDCDKAIYRVYRYLDGELTVWRRWTIRRHLDKCPPCAQGFDFEIELRQVISTKCRDEVPPELAAASPRRSARQLPPDDAALRSAAPPCGNYCRVVPIRRPPTGAARESVVPASPTS